MPSRRSIPHDLLGLWLYPSHGGVVLLGPEALAQDELAVPLRLPQVEPARCDVLEDIVRDAGYRSVAWCRCARGGATSGLMLAPTCAPTGMGRTSA